MRHNLFSIRRTFPLLCLLLLFAFAAREIMDPDFWWHLRTGHYIVQHHAVPHSDIFSSLFAGKPWITHEWLSEAFMYGLYSLGHWNALIVAFAAIVAGAFLFTYLRCEGKPFVALAAVALAALASFPAWGVRPQMITFLLVSIFLWALDNDDPARRRRLWCLIPLMWLWANLHAGFTLGLALIFFFLAASAVEARTSHSPEALHRFKTLACVSVGCIAVVPLNPNGARLFLYAFETLRSSAMRRYLSEWQSPNFHNSAFVPFAAMLLLTFAVLAVSPKQVRLRSLLLLAGASFAALQSMRHIPLFVIVAAPILAEHLSAMPLWSRVNARFGSPSRLFNLVGVAALAFVALTTALRVHKVARNETAWEPVEFPAAAVQFLNTHRPPGPLFNPYHWGGYLIWNAPEYPVFIDGRADLYGDDFVADYFRSARGENDGRKLLDQYGIQTALTETRTPMHAALRDDAQWKIVFQDKQAVIFTRK